MPGPAAQARITAAFRFLLICLGGAVGTEARYLIATLTVNVAGSFLLGAVMHVGLTTALMTPGLRVVLATGVMGGFTTYSTFNYETIEYLREGAFEIAALNVAATLLLCLLAGALGLAAARWAVGS